MSQMTRSFNIQLAAEEIKSALLENRKEFLTREISPSELMFESRNLFGATKINGFVVHSMNIRGHLKKIDDANTSITLQAHQEMTLKTLVSICATALALVLFAKYYFHDPVSLYLITIIFSIPFWMRFAYHWQENMLMKNVAEYLRRLERLNSDKHFDHQPKNYS
ncbi:hypothetical protein FNO01nite_26050 [Flavobacterium noncentrifugens]|uniref:Uncharacterized protein n=1 Tax=Flavobacterium noncentrifugens TaxID=1128970 RepID=A0A1G8ZH76_9FLAO|nr:hypothetical protein [Flavobacterium noncentrifugens]GEP51933.1 hypothetical protein FNO01nite_26050 [Flavobacterium noncentrifugens]SDK14449.1 hypothetical protein SAMN04487935_2594 [Flavobacterium noncentrifugens]